MQLFTSGLKGRISREESLLLIVHTSFIAGLPATNKLFNKRRGGKASRNCRREASRDCRGERVGAASPEVTPRGLSPRRQSASSSRSDRPGGAARESAERGDVSPRRVSSRDAKINAATAPGQEFLQYRLACCYSPGCGQVSR